MKHYYPIGYKKITVPITATKLKLNTGVELDVIKITPGCGSFSVKAGDYTFTEEGLWVIERDYKHTSSEVKTFHHENFVVSYEPASGSVEIIPTIKCHIFGDKLGNNFVSISKKDIIKFPPRALVSFKIIDKGTKIYLREKDQFTKIIDLYGETINFDITFGKLDYSKHPLLTNPS